MLQAHTLLVRVTLSMFLVAALFPGADFASAGPTTTPSVVETVLVDTEAGATLELPLTCTCTQAIPVRLFLAAGPEIFIATLVVPEHPGLSKPSTVGEFNQVFAQNPITISFSQTVSLSVANFASGPRPVTFGAVFIGNPNE